MAPKRLEQSEKARRYVNDQRQSRERTEGRNGDAIMVSPVVQDRSMGLDVRATATAAGTGSGKSGGEIGAHAEAAPQGDQDLRSAPQDVDRPKPRRLKLSERIGRRLGFRVGTRIKARMGESMADNYIVSTGQKSAGKTAAVAGVVSAGTIITVFGLVRAFWPDLIWPSEMDGEVADKIAGAIAVIVSACTAIGYLWGLVTNLYKNWQRAKNGVRMTPDSEPVFDWAPKD